MIFHHEAEEWKNEEILSFALWIVMDLVLVLSLVIKRPQEAEAREKPKEENGKWTQRTLS